MTLGIESFQFQVPEGCVDLGCISYCNETAQVASDPGIPFFWYSFWLAVFALTALLLALIFMACCTETPSPAPPTPPPRYRISMVVEARLPDGQMNKRKVQLSPCVPARTVRRNNLEHNFIGFLDPDDINDNDYEVLLQKQSGVVSNLKLDFNLVDQDVEENDTIIFKHKDC